MLSIVRKKAQVLWGFCAGEGVLLWPSDQGRLPRALMGKLICEE